MSRRSLVQSERSATRAACRAATPGRARCDAPAGAARIAHGHPLGATGAGLVTKLVSELERTGKRYGLSTMCIGFGQGIATIVERI